MNNIDRRLLENIQKSHDYFQQEYGTLDHVILACDVSSKGQNIQLELQTLQATIRECKEEVEDNTVEDIKNILSLVYHIDLSQDYKPLIMKKLESLNKRFLHVSSEERIITEELLQTYREDIRLIETIIESIDKRVYQLESMHWWHHYLNQKRITEYKRYRDKFSKLNTSMIECFDLMSAMITNAIVESFHYVYLFLAYCIKFFIASNDQIFLIELAATIDHYKKILQPLRASNALKPEFLRSSYVVQEFRELQKRILEYA